MATRSLPELCLARPVATTTCVVGAIVLGLVSLERLPVEYLPEMQGRSLTVSASYSASSAREIERTIVRPLEEALASLPGLESLSSTAQSSGADVRIELVAGTDVDTAALEVRERLDRARPELPEDLGKIEVRRWRSTDRPVLRCRVAPRRDLSARARERFVDDVLIPRLSRVQGVGNVEVRGLRRRRVLVELDRERLASAGLTAGAIAGTLRQRNRNAAAGLLRNRGRVLSIRVLGELGDASAVAALPLGDGRLLSDVATVREELPPLDRVERLDGSPAITVEVSKESGANTIATCEGVKAELDAILDTPLANGFSVEIYSDQSERILARLRNLQFSGLYGGVLLCMILFVFLRQVRSTLIVASTIPLSIVFTFGIVFVARRLGLPLTLNVVSMMGLILGIGLVVDNGIVVLENVVRLRDQGLPPKQAAAQGAAEVARAVTASMLTSLIVFVPLLFSESMGMRWVKDLGYMVCASVFSSLWVALSVVPLLSAYLLPAPRPGATEAKASEGWIVRGYGRVLGLSLSWQGKLLLLLVLPLCAWQLWHFFQSVEQSWGGGDSDREVRLTVQVPRAYGQQEREALFGRLEALVLEQRTDLDLARLTTSFRTSAEARESRRGRHGRGGSQDYLELVLNDGPGERKSMGDVRAHLRGLLPEIPGVQLNLDASRRMGGGGRSVQVLVEGRSSDELDAPARAVARVLATVPGVEGVELGEAFGALGLEVRPRREATARFDLAASQVGQAVASTLGERTVTRLRNPRRELEVLMRLNEDDRSGLDDLARTRVPRSDGMPLAVGTLASIHSVPAPRQIKREDRAAVSTVTATVLEGQEVRTVTGRVEAALAELSLPAGVRWRLGREQRRWRRGEGESADMTILAFALVLIVLCALFESYLQPLVIATTVPFALVGVAWAFLLTDTNLDDMAWIGLMILIGIAVNHGIVLVDRVNRLLAEGVGPREALVRSGRDRLRPILMTAGTTVLGLLPIVLQHLLPEVFNADSGAQMYGPIGLAVASGLIVSTVLTLLVLPAVLSVAMDGLRLLRGEAAQ
jgi:HAE1 family hydrophobic/amphiphilic exporter-1